MTIVGMKYYDERNQSFDRIAAASTLPVEDQLLFLVQDEHNKFDGQAVMLHDGVRKLGHVVMAEAPIIRSFLNTLAAEKGRDQVLVVAVAPIISRDSFKWSSSFNVRCVGTVYERVARKHASATTGSTAPLAPPKADPLTFERRT